MVIKKIISGGQTGADRAALDVSIELGIPHGGWIPKGRLTENGPLPDQYQLREMPTESYPQRTEKNVIDSDGTLIISHGKLNGASALTRKLARKYGRPCLHTDLRKMSAFEPAEKINTWIKKHGIKVLNVAGPRASRDPAIYQATVNLLKAAFYMDVIEAQMPDPYPTTLPHLPKTVEEAVDCLILGMSVKDKTKIARMDEDELSSLQPTVGSYIRDKFGLTSGNSELKRSCRYLSKKYDIHEDDASALIINELWKKLRETHAMRVVK